MQWCVFVVFVGGTAADVVVPNLARAQHEPDKFKMTLAFDGKKQVDGRGAEMQLLTDPKSGRQFSKESPKSSVPLPIKVSFEKLPGSEPKLLSRDYRFAILDPEGNVLPGRIMLPYDADPKTGVPTGPKVREIALGDKPCVDGPKMSLQLGGDPHFPRLKPGRYTVICVMQGQITSKAFVLNVD